MNIQSKTNIRRIEQFFRPLLWLSAVFLVVLTLSKAEVVVANPEGGVVASGNAVIGTSGNTTQITQSSSKAIIDWRSFNIAAQETTQFSQPSPQAVALNRVDATQGASNILGHLSANGQVWLVNPAGIFFGAGSTVDVAGLVATTANISNTDFLSGNYHFTGGQGSVINAGTINITDGGIAALVAPTVVNSGVIRANLGKVGLGAGSDFTLDFYGDNLINFDVGSSGNSVTNSGKIVANGGTVLLTAQTAQGVVNNVINMSGVIQANSVRQHNGTIILSGGSHGIVNVSGKLIAAGHHHHQTGGTVKILGDEVALTDNAVVDTSGNSGGGTVLIGGDAHGAGADQNATYTYIGSDTTINASAVNNGNGGTVVIWSDKGTQFYGDINAQGGSQSGNGGWVETSGKAWLNALGLVNASAQNGLAGTWLLDPENVTITTSTSNNATSGSNPITWTPSGNNSTINASSISAELTGGSNVLVTTGSSGSQNGDITVSSSISDTGTSPVTLTLQAAGNITFNSSAGISATHPLNIVLDAASTGGTGIGGILLSSGTVISSAGGNITLGGGALSGGLPSGAAVGSSAFANGNGIELNNAQLQAGSGSIGGNITLNGTGAASGSGSYRGVFIGNGSQLVTTGAGSISITGQGGAGSSAAGNYGVSSNQSTIKTQGTGTLTITGTGGSAGSGNNFGILLLGGTVQSMNGTLTLMGTAGASGSSGSNGGILAGSDVLVESTGTGNIAITGIGGNTSGGTNQGIAFLNGQIETTSSGTITLTGTGNGTGGGNDGIILFFNGAPAITSNSGSITLNGTGSLLDGSLGIEQEFANGALSGPSLIINAVNGATLTAANTITNTFNATNTITGDISFTNTSSPSPLTITGISQSVGNLTINNTGGSITETGAIIVSGVATFTVNTAGSSILLASAANNFSSTPVFTNNGDILNLALRNINSSAVIPTLPTNLNNLTVSFDNAAIVLPTLTLTGALSVTSGGVITESGVLNVPTVTTSSSGGTTLNNANTITTFSATNANSGDIQLNDAVTVLNVNAVTETGSGNISLANTGEVITNGVIQTQGGNINVFGGNSLIVNNTLSTDPASQGVLTIDGGVTMNALQVILGSGNITLNGNGPNVVLVNLTVNGTTIINANNVSGTINTNALVLDTNSANLTGTVGGSAGLSAVNNIFVAKLSQGAYFFNGLDLFSAAVLKNTDGNVIFIGDESTGFIVPIYQLSERTETNRNGNQGICSAW